MKSNTEKEDSKTESSSKKGRSYQIKKVSKASKTAETKQVQDKQKPKTEKASTQKGAAKPKSAKKEKNFDRWNVLEIEKTQFARIRKQGGIILEYVLRYEKSWKMKRSGPTAKRSLEELATFLNLQRMEPTKQTKCVADSDNIDSALKKNAKKLMK